jgi:surface protein
MAFNQPLNDWDTSQVTTMRYMFCGTSAFNQRLTFNTAQVKDMSFMLNGARAFNQTLAFNTAQVKDMSFMFCGATLFNRPLVFNTSQVTNMHRMFYYARAFNQPLDWDTSQVTDMSYMFRNAMAFNQPLTFDDTSQVTTMRSMFGGASSFNQPLALDTSQVTDMRSMFHGATAFNQPITFDTSQVTEMGNIFEGSHSPLWYKCAEGIDITQLLTVPGIDVNQVAPDGRTPLWWACAWGHTKIVAQLLAVPGIVANQANNDGMTPFSTACKYGHKEGHFDIVQQLLEYSAKIMGTEKEYRQRLAEDAEKVQDGQLNKLTLSQFVDSTFPNNTSELNAYDSFSRMQGIDCPVRCLPCKHPFEASALQTWFQTPVANYDRNHTACTECRKTPKYIEIMNRRQIERWNTMSATEKEAESKLQNLRNNTSMYERWNTMSATEKEAESKLSMYEVQGQMNADAMKEASQKASLVELTKKIQALHTQEDVLHKKYWEETSNDASKMVAAVGMTRSLRKKRQALQTQKDDLHKAAEETRKRLEKNKVNAQYNTYVKQMEAAKQTASDNSLKSRFKSNAPLKF